jgi:hypothetical protein
MYKYEGPKATSFSLLPFYTACRWVETSILGAFAKLQKANINFVLSVHLSVRIQHLGYHWTDFSEIPYLRIFFPKSVEKIQVLLKSDKNNGCFT